MNYGHKRWPVSKEELGVNSSRFSNYVCVIRYYICVIWYSLSTTDISCCNLFMNCFNLDTCLMWQRRFYPLIVTNHSEYNIYIFISSIILKIKLYMNRIKHTKNQTYRYIYIQNGDLFGEVFSPCWMHNYKLNISCTMSTF